jgi:glycosyl transferase family 25
MRVMVISLESAVERRRALLPRLESLGVRADVFRGIDGRADEDLKYPNSIGTRPGRGGVRLTPGMRGCTASHWLVWQECARSGEPVAILEDDIALTDKFPAVLALGEQLASECGLIRLYGLFARRYRTVRRFPDRRQLVRYWRGPSGLQAYVVSPAAAATLVERAPLWTEAPDDYVDRFWFHGVQPFALLPFEVSRTDFGSTTADTEKQTPDEQWARTRRRREDRRQRIVSNLRWRLRLGVGYSLANS